MSFDIGFYKDHILNKLGEAKDRAASVIKQLDNCDVKLKISTTTTRDNNDSSKPKMGPWVRSRSKSKCKHSYEHSTERIYREPRHHHCDSDWSDGDDYDSDCSCSDCHPHFRPRGRSPSIHIDGRNVDQQNILIKGCCSGGKHTRKHCRPRSRSRPVIVVPTQRGRQPRHPDGHCCIHGLGPRAFCSLCPPYGRNWLPINNHIYRAVTNDDGKIDVYDGLKQDKYFHDKVQGILKAAKDKKDAEEKEKNDILDKLGKLYKDHEHDSLSSIMGHAGHSYYGGQRSADEIRKEIVKVQADMAQLHALASLEAQENARKGELESLLGDDTAWCHGALQDDNNSSDDVGKQGKKTAATPLKSSMKKVRIDPGIKAQQRIEELADSDIEEDDLKINRGHRKKGCPCCQ